MKLSSRKLGFQYSLNSFGILVNSLILTKITKRLSLRIIELQNVWLYIGKNIDIILESIISEALYNIVEGFIGGR